MLSPEIWAALFLVGLAAGFVDAIAGGGGLLTVPALLWAGLSPAETLATNKLQGSFGTASATWHFVRRGYINPREILPAVAFTFAGTAAGTILIQMLDATFLITIIPFMLVSVAIYVLFSPRMADEDAHQRLGRNLFAALFGLTLGFYDGFFGPGTGSFWFVAFVALAGYNVVKATAHAKVVNFTSNIAALLFFAFGGKIMWGVGLAMAAGQLLGAQLGAHSVTRLRGRLVRPVLVAVSLAMTIKLMWDNPTLRDGFSYLQGLFSAPIGL